MVGKFSAKLTKWLKSPGAKTFGGLENTFQEKSFAVAFLILMITAALPLPTGGITHIFEIITMILALELVAGRKKIWSPKFWRNRNLGKVLEDTALPKMVKFIEWFEKRSQKRLDIILNNQLFLRFVGFVVFIFSLGAALAIPFSGLDTLPALGVVVISLSLILEDALVFLFGMAIGISGIYLEFALGRAALHFLH